LIKIIHNQRLPPQSLKQVDCLHLMKKKKHYLSNQLWSQRNHQKDRKEIWPRLLSRRQPPCPPLRSKRRSAKPFLLSCLRLTSLLSLSFPSQEAEILSLRSELSSARSQLSALDLKLKSSEREVGEQEGRARRLEEEKVSEPTIYLSPLSLLWLCVMFVGREGWRDRWRRVIASRKSN
jgi:hypothetical protein